MTKTPLFRIFLLFSLLLLLTGARYNEAKTPANAYNFEYLSTIKLRLPSELQNFENRLAINMQITGYSDGKLILLEGKERDSENTELEINLNDEDMLIDLEKELVYFLDDH